MRATAPILVLVVMAACQSTQPSGAPDAGSDAWTDPNSGDCGCLRGPGGSCDCSIFPCGPSLTCKFNSEFCLVSGFQYSCLPIPPECRTDAAYCACVAASTGLSNCTCGGGAGSVPFLELGCGTAHVSGDAASDVGGDVTGDEAADAAADGSAD